MSKICTQCVMNETAPIMFDINHGGCIYCCEWQKKERKRVLEKSMLPWIVYDIKKKNCQYDVLLGLSGGVDSSLCLHYCIEQGLKPLCFSVDNGWNSQESDENIMRMVETLKVPFERHVLDLDEFKELQLAFLKAGVINAEIPSDHAIRALQYKLADKYKIKYIISGGNHVTEGIMPDVWSYDASDLTHIKDIYKKFTGNKLKNFPTLSLWKYIWYRFIKRIKTINLLDYYEYDKEKAKKLLTEKYGWKDYGDKHCESLYTKWFQNVYLPAKFGIDKRRAHFSTLINSKQITRDNALELLKINTIDNELTKKVHKKFGVASHIWNEIMKSPRRLHEYYKTDQKIRNFLSKIYKKLK